MSTEEEELLKSLATRYLWWQTPDEALRRPDRIIAQVMDLATLEDADDLERVVGHSAMIDVLRRAAPGWLRPRSWTYWHHRLGLVDFPAHPPRVHARLIAS
jgi:hypothetical protein